MLYDFLFYFIICSHIVFLCGCMNYFAECAADFRWKLFCNSGQLNSKIAVFQLKNYNIPFWGVLEETWECLVFHFPFFCYDVLLRWFSCGIHLVVDKTTESEKEIEIFCYL